jgi:hypothetical protein
VDEIDRALSELRRAVLERGREPIELSTPYRPNVPERPYTGQFQQETGEATKAESRSARLNEGMYRPDDVPEPPSGKLTQSNLSEVREASAGRSAEDVEPRAFGASAIRDTVRKEMEEHKSPQSPIRKFVDALKRTFRW